MQQPRLTIAARPTAAPRNAGRRLAQARAAAAQADAGAAGRRLQPKAPRRASRTLLGAKS